jgi:hypothetical protein
VEGIPLEIHCRHLVQVDDLRGMFFSPTSLGGRFVKDETRMENGWKILVLRQMVLEGKVQQPGLRSFYVALGSAWSPAALLLPPCWTAFQRLRASLALLVFGGSQNTSLSSLQPPRIVLLRCSWKILQVCHLLLLIRDFIAQ